MGFNGRPSSGCVTCRKRKKRCDQIRPQCGQCSFVGKQCPGIPNEIDLMFRNKFSSDTPDSFEYPAVRKSTRNGRKNPLALTLLERKSDDEQKACGLAQHIPINPQDLATTYFLNLHCRRDLPTRRLNPWLGLQSKYYMASQPGSALNHAVVALACITMATETNMPELAEASNKPYTAALRAINDAIADPVESMKNEIAIAIFVLISYELKHHDVDRRRHYQAHTDGLKQLLVLRGQKQLADIECLYVFRALRVTIIYNYMLRGQPLYDDDDEFLWTNQSPYNATPVDDLCAIAATISHLRAQVKRIRSAKSDSISRILLVDAFRVDHKLKQWLGKWQDHLNYSISFRDDDQAWQGKAHVFTDLSHSALMNHYCFLRLLVLGVIVKGHRDIATRHEEAMSMPEEVLEQIRESIDTICFSIPYITGQIRNSIIATSRTSNQKHAYISQAEATWIMLPIVIAAQQSNILPEQKKWMVQQLLHLNTEFGLLDSSSLPLNSEEKLQASPSDFKVEAGMSNG